VRTGGWFCPTVVQVLRFLLRPRWLAWHAALLGVLISFTTLGIWQLDSFEHNRPATADRAAVPIDRLTRPGGRLVGDDVARRVTAQGRYDVARQLLVPGRERDGRPGYLVVTPLRTATGVVPVLRGWVPAATSPAATPPSGDVTVTGRLQRSEPRDASRVDPLDPLPAGRLAYISSVSLLDTWPYSPDELVDGYVVSSRESPAPRAAPARVVAETPDAGVGRWRNLAYALQWWLFAGAAMFFYGSVVRRAVTERRQRDQASDQASPPVTV
jgi:cytochrome oxidase assembly protein ShyY1